MDNSIRRPIARFEDFEVKLETGEVWKAGRPLKVQDQPFKVLSALLEQPGQIVTREELRQRIWPEQSFGDFDHAINLTMAKLRATLGDSADVPHLIETLPRRGYRFIAPLKEQTDSDPPPLKQCSNQDCRKKALADRWGLGTRPSIRGHVVTVFPNTSEAVANCRRDRTLGLYVAMRELC
jgi:DNA-binding winged helix-turn-helix (wHTH) protein